MEKFREWTDDIDPECAEKHKKYFSDTMKWLKEQWGY